MSPSPICLQAVREIESGAPGGEPLRKAVGCSERGAAGALDIGAYEHVKPFE